MRAGGSGKDPLGDLDDFGVSAESPQMHRETLQDLYTFDAELDLTRAQIDFDWWLRKPIGVGCSIRVSSRIRAQKKHHARGDGAIDATISMQTSSSITRRRNSIPKTSVLY